MKKLFVCVCLIAMLLTGCSHNSLERSEIKQRFATVEKYGNYSIIVDLETNVMYLKFETSSYKYGITVLLNSDGTPMLWDGE